MNKPPSPKLENIDGDRYRLSEDYVIKIGYWLRKLQLTIPANYVTDLASIPPMLRPFADRASLGITAVVFHDWLCDNRGKFTNLDGEEIQLTWFQTQLYFLVLLELDGIPWQRSLAAFLAVLVGNRWDLKVSPEYYQQVDRIAIDLDRES
jgi:hypothetical protein